MGNFYSKRYWSVGFQSRLYDRLSPESYFESMRRVVAQLPKEKFLSLLDAGCGSGLLLNFLQEAIREGMDYTGIDLLESGVGQTLLRAQELGIADRVSCFQSDLTSPLPANTEKFDVVVGHFSLYPLATDELRQVALKNLSTLLKSKGLLVLVNPSIGYDADLIVDQSIQLVRERYGFFSSLVKQYFIYPFTKLIGLRFIQKQLNSKSWKAYTREEFSREMEHAGFKALHVEEVYAGGAFLGCFVRNQ